MANKVEEIKKAKDGLDVWPDLLRYSKEGYGAIEADDFTRMRWYGIYQQQPNEGHFMLRVKIPSGDVSAAQWRRMGEIARDYGQGIADITTRQNIQFHWLTIETIPEVLEKLGEAGLTTVGACGDITRNVTGCPVSGLAPDEIYDARPIVMEISNFFHGNKDFSDLPRKYKMTVAGCAHQCHMPQINDVGVSAFRMATGEVRFHVRVGGGLSTQPYFGQRLNLSAAPEQVADVVRAVTEIFRDDGYRQRRNHARLKFLVADWGAERFTEEVIRRLGWTPGPAYPELETPILGGDHVGIHAQRQPGLCWIGCAVLTGRLTAAKVLAAAEIADEFTGGVLRTTNQQNLLFPNVAEERLEAAKAALRLAGFQWEVSQYRRSSIACTGNEFCNLAITETKDKLREIVAHLEERLPIDEEIRINLNGCPNACGQHHIGDIGLMGCLARVGDEKVEAYDICLGGRLGADPKFVRPIERKVPATKVKYALENLLRGYLSNRDEADVFANWTDRHSDEELGVFLGLGNLAEPDPDWVPPPPKHCATIAE